LKFEVSKAFHFQRTITTSKSNSHTQRTRLLVSAVPRRANRREGSNDYDNYDEDDWLTPYSGERDTSSSSSLSSSDQSRKENYSKNLVKPNRRQSLDDSSSKSSSRKTNFNRLYPPSSNDDTYRQNRSLQPVVGQVDITDTNAHFFSKKIINGSIIENGRK